MATVIHVKEMKEEEALLELLGHELHTIDRESTRFCYAHDIAVQLGYMPLAIELALAYVENTSLSFEKYLSQLKLNRRRLFSYYDEESLGDYPHSIASVWNISFNRVREINPAAVPILEVCTFLHPDEIPTLLFECQYRTFNFCSNSQSRETESLECESVQMAIALLNKFSLVPLTVRDTEGKGTELMDHPDTAASLYSPAVLYRVQDKYEQAEPLFQRALAIGEKGLGPDHPDTIASLQLSGQSLLSSGQVRAGRASTL
ncbi:uncharacterized protein VTP21DRAFT_3380 [Calcarisporiella thermophila]|uniref:uncharacterized protein n=1 Tax=Calcarisporiella thermophila TaxID=911321 RepID=UPI003743D98D